MENCLVKKLKGSVDNPNLPIFGVLTLNVEYTSGATDDERKLFFRLIPGSHRFYTNNNESTFSIYASNGTTVIAADVYDYTITNQSNMEIYILLSNADYKFYVDKCGFSYGLMYPSDSVRNVVKIYSVDVSEFEYTPVINLELVGVKTTGTFKLKDKSTLISSFFSQPSSNHVIQQDNSVLDLNELEGCVNLKNIIKYGGQIKGSINKLNGCVQLTAVYLPGYFAPNNDFVGDLNALAAAQVAAGRTSGTIKLSIENSKVKWDNVEVSQLHNPKRIVFDSQATGGYTIYDTIQ